MKKWLVAMNIIMCLYIGGTMVASVLAAAIPDKSDLTGGTLTQGQFRAGLDALHDYLTGLLDSDGTAASARTALGLGDAATRSTGTGSTQVPLNAHLGTAAYINHGTSANLIVRLDSSGRLPAVSGALLTNLPSQAPFAAGTRMLFQQTSCPSGWTKDVSASTNNRAVRITTGSAGSGGADGFTTVFTTGRTTDGKALVAGDLPIFSLTVPGAGGGTGGSTTAFALAPIGQPVIANISTSSIGSGNSHWHDLSNMNLAYIDFIVCQKD